MPSGGEIESGIFRPVFGFLHDAVDVPRVAEMPHAVPPMLTAHVAEHHALRPVEAKNALSNLNTNSAAILREFGGGAGFSGVYNHESGKFLAYPSGNTVLRSGEYPANLVSRYGGHHTANDVLSRTLDVDSRANVGFVAVMKSDGSFGFRWTSRSVNGRNPSFDGVQVPEHLRAPIMDAFTRATGRVARSDA
jgi:hypothetical protein